jgi:hypothetical protein
VRHPLPSIYFNEYADDILRQCKLAKKS